MNDITNGPPDDKAAGFFGRRKGKALRGQQSERIETLLPKLAVDAARPIDAGALFPAATEVWLEIGFGGGEHLAHMAAAHPDVGVIGCEPFVNGVAKLLGEIQSRSLTNVRIHAGNASDVLAKLPAASLERIYLLYPDPWPKRRQRKRRFVSDKSLKALARVLRPGGHFRFATDIDDYAGWVLRRIARSSDFIWTAESASDWTTPFEGWPGTRYEAKAMREGRAPSYLTFRRR